MIVVAMVVLVLVQLFLWFWNRDEGLPWDDLRRALLNGPPEVLTAVSVMFLSLFVWGLFLGVLVGVWGCS